MEKSKDIEAFLDFFDYDFYLSIPDNEQVISIKNLPHIFMEMTEKEFDEFVKLVKS